LQLKLVFLLKHKPTLVASFKYLRIYFTAFERLIVWVLLRPTV